MAQMSPLNRRQKAALPTLTRRRSVQGEKRFVAAMDRKALSISSMLTLLSTGSQLSSLSCWIRFRLKARGFSFLTEVRRRFSSSVLMRLMVMLRWKMVMSAAYP